MTSKESFTRRDYVAVSEIIRSFADDMPVKVVEEMAEDFIALFEKDDPNFKSDRFYEACFEGTKHE
jgi:hypothetical protein